MTEASISREALLAALVIDGAIAMISGRVQGKAPVEPLMLSPEQRDALGLSPKSLPLFYPVGKNDEGVFFEMSGPAATVWFVGGDCASALKVLEGALKRAHPNASQIDDVAHASDSELRSRAYRIELGDNRIATLDIAYPAKAGGKRPRFAVRVSAQQRQAN